MKTLKIIFDIVKLFAFFCIGVLLMASTQISQIGWGPTTPGTPASGTGYRLWYDTDDYVFKYWNNVAWVTLGADNLGNHTATQDLAMSGFDITVPDNTSNAFDLKITGTSTNFLSANSTDGAEQTSVGTTTVGSILNLGSETTTINGSQKVAGRTITASGTSPLAAGDYYVRLDATTGAKTITLPTVTGYFVLKFKRVDNNPGTAIIFTGTVDGTVNPNSTTGGSPIAALATQYASLTLIYNGSSWDVAD